MKRIKRLKKSDGGSQFLAASSELVFIKTGCTMLDLVLGGGWPLGRIVNIVGDKSTGKTLLAIEAAANFAKTFPRGKIWYRETESAFQKSYAAALGMPIDRVDFGKKGQKIHTVQEFHNDLAAKARYCIKNNRAGLYILDSLDAVSDRKEAARAIDKDSYGGDKAKFMSELFRRLAQSVEEAQMCVIIISQVRDKINAMFGRKTSRSGGRAMDFYASHVVYLSHLGNIERKRSSQSRSIGVQIRAKCDKNKVALPFRQCDFRIRFGFGIEDLQANVAYLKEAKRLKAAGLSIADGKELLRSTDDLSDVEYKELLDTTQEAVRRVWMDTERSFLPPRRKY